MSQYPPYLIRKGGADGLQRYYWQPSSQLRADGYRPMRVPTDWSTYSDPAALELAAIAKADDLNAELARKRQKDGVAAVEANARTVGELIKRYRAHRAFRELRDTSRRTYGQCLDILVERFGDTRLRDLDRRQIEKMREDMSATPAKFNHVATMLHIVLSFGARQGLMRATSMADRPGKFFAPPSGIPWPKEAVAALVRAADAMGRHSIGTAVMLNAWCGQREGDILRLQWRAYAGGDLLIRQSKTGAGVKLPVGDIPELRERLADEFARCKARRAPRWARVYRSASAPRRREVVKVQSAEDVIAATTIIVSEYTRRPYTGDGFRKAFQAVQAEAAKTAPIFAVDFPVPGRKPGDPMAFAVQMGELQFMDLRHTAVTRLAEAGCEDSMICSITGHSHAGVARIITRYLSRTKKLAREAFRKRLAFEARAVQEADAFAVPDTTKSVV